MPAHTIVEYFAEHEGYRCGYCGQSDSNYSHGMWAHAMTVQDYQDLLDRGWRRSGKYCYKPTMNRMCCPHYTIRCEALNFKLRKSHKKVLKKVNKYLIHGIKPTSDDKDEELEAPNDKAGDKSKEKDKSDKLEKSHDSEGTSVDIKPADETSATSSGSQHKTPRKGDGADPSKPPCKKAKELRQERKLAKLSAKNKAEHVKGSLYSSETGKSLASNKYKFEINMQDDPGKASQSKGDCEGKTLEDFLSEPNKAENPAHKLEIRLVRSCPRSEEFEASLAETHSVYHKYQMMIHNDTPDKPSLKQFTRFLVDSPLEETHPDGTLPMGYGSFHQQYILDGKIICVGVIDILPNLVSSKYLYYDPDYNFLSLGTYSALRELAFVRELHRHSSEMIYYYMGFYIHSCPKMKYKGQYHPSFLLCPETYGWYPVEECAKKLDQNKYVRFAPPDKKDENEVTSLEDVLVLHQRQLMNYPIYCALSRRTNNDEDEVKEYAGFVGKKCANSILLFRK